MTFSHHAFVALVLVTLTLAIQSIGMVVLIEWMKAKFRNGVRHIGISESLILVVRFTSLLVCLQILEMLLWASFYRWKAFPTWESSFYFSLASYSTVGATDLSLDPSWRIIGALESVAGVLMCGLSAGLLFAIVHRLAALVDPALADQRASGLRLIPSAEISPLNTELSPAVRKPPGKR